MPPGTYRHSATGSMLVWGLLQENKRARFDQHSFRMMKIGLLGTVAFLVKAQGCFCLCYTNCCLAQA